MKFVATALATLTFGAAVVSTSAAPLGRSSTHSLPEGTECVLYLKHTLFEDGHGEEKWCCEFTQEQVKKNGGVKMMMEIDGLTQEAIEAKGAVSGETILKAKSAYVERSDGAVSISKNVLHLPEDSEYEVEEMDWETDKRHTRNRRARRQRHRNLADSNPGTLNVLVVRTIDSNGVTPTATILELENDIFTDDVCLKTQYAACSHDQLVMKQATEFSTTVGNVQVNGVVNINIDTSIASGKDAIEAAAKIEATAQFKGAFSDLSETFDLVIFCQPPGTGDWVGFAYLNSWDGYYNDYWCQRVSVQMHEVGHNLNLGHSGRPAADVVDLDLPEDLIEYADISGMMGYSYNEDDVPKMCFNAAKSYQLGWYDLQTASFNPLDFVGTPRTFVINGVADYKVDGTSSGELVSLRLENQGGLDYYIGYNRAIGANSGTNDVPNTVTLLEKENGPKDYGKSRRLAAMNVGQSNTIQSYGGTILDVIVTVNSIDGKDATITISTSELFPTGAPSSAPTQNCDGRFQLVLQTDTYSFETAWTITNKDTGEVIGQKNRFEHKDSILYSFPETGSYCLPNGCYTFLITDYLNQNGICCNYGEGFFKGYLDGNPIAIFDGGEFGASDTREFCVDSSVTSPPQQATQNPSQRPTQTPTQQPTKNPTQKPTVGPSNNPTRSPTKNPTKSPTKSPTKNPTQKPTVGPSNNPTRSPTQSPTQNPTVGPSSKQTGSPTTSPTNPPTNPPTAPPTTTVTNDPSNSPTTVGDVTDPTSSPTSAATTTDPTESPTSSPTSRPSNSPTTITPAPQGSCTNTDETFKIKKKETTCIDLESQKKKKKKKLCKKKTVLEACPAICNIKCTCKDEKTFKFKGKKRKCKKVNKEGQPKCTDDINNKNKVFDLCPKKCGACFGQE